MQTQKIKTRAPRQLSEQEIINYFFPRHYPLWTSVALAAGAILLTIGILLQYAILIIAALLLELCSWLIIYRTRRANPSDAQYDAWVESQARTLYRRGLQILGITKSSMRDPVLRVQSYVLPGSREANEYVAEDVWMKRGKDGKWRFSINVYTYIYPTAQSLAIFRGDINAFNQLQYNDMHEVYSYRHIVTATTSPLRDTISVDGQKFPYRTEQLCLKISNGETIPLSATVKMGPLGSVPGVPPMALPDTGFTKALNKLRQLLLSRT